MLFNKARLKSACCKTSLAVLYCI